MSNPLLEQEEAYAQLRQRVLHEQVVQWQASQQRRQGCALMPSQAHCWHEQMRLWDTLFPPAMVCCWCGSETEDSTAVPHRHGPHAEMR